MLKETMTALKFPPAQINKREYLGEEFGEDDAIGMIDTPHRTALVLLYTISLPKLQVTEILSFLFALTTSSIYAFFV
jgi:hypothetical protein